ncbi:spore germination protein GerPE [Paenibacillus sp. 1011MAR3C5]|uniref:spore germination protein GerPE n=1 Tax=Paenibacillus sp. 1011MAR3C5 TaxID=1675787 RepID=UPI001602BBB8|nr:spore germination protein GerPE [Paenibacillus sp. 1011MAR3C5]
MRHNHSASEDASCIHHPTRTSQVGAICIISASSSTAIQFGDRCRTDARLLALAVQRKEDHATSGDVYFESYRIFSRPAPILIDPAFDEGRVLRMSRTNCEPCIRVGFIRVIAAGNSTSIHIGNGHCVTGNSRIKHIRQYPKESITQPDIPNPEQPALASP